MFLQRFLDAQQNTYAKALSEIKAGRKQTHWMWFIFPQLAGLGRSDTARFYGIKDIDEATEYFFHPILGKRLIEISTTLLNVSGKSAHEIFGHPDDLKLQSCMTLFLHVTNADPVFSIVLNKYFNGNMDDHTKALINT